MSQSVTHPRRKSFLITIDTEGDNLWALPRQVTTKNSRYLPRFQNLCEKYAFKPTYLTNWEMVQCPYFRDFARDVLSRGVGEIGMHLHAWNSPPVVSLTDDDDTHQPYLIEYPQDQIREKVKVMTGLLEDTFGVKMISHRAGRWAFDTTYAGALIEHGYLVDCSVTPHVSWAQTKGDPQGAGGTDYTQFPESAYFLDLEDISRPGDSPLLEVPMTVVNFRYPSHARVVRDLLRRSRLGAAVARRLFPDQAWLRARGEPPSWLPTVIHAACQQGLDHVEFTLHSSEFMPGGSPYFLNERSIEALYRALEAMFEAATSSFVGRTLSEYHAYHVHSRKTQS